MHRCRTGANLYTRSHKHAHSHTQRHADIRQHADTNSHKYAEANQYSRANEHTEADAGSVMRMLNRLARLSFAIALVLSAGAPLATFASGRRAQLSDPVARGVGSARVVASPGGVTHATAEPISSSSSTGPIMLPLLSIVGAATDRARPLSDVDRTALLMARVAQAPPISLRICNGDTGCTSLITDTLATDTPLILYAAGYDGDTFVGNQPVTWTVPPAATMSPTEGVSATLDGDVPGSVIVTATMITTPTIFTTATLTVTLGALDSILIRDGANGGGNVAIDATRTAGSAWNLYAAGHDTDGNFIADQVVTWTLQGGIGSLAPQVGSSTVFTAGTAGTGSISAMVQANPTITDATGTITVVHGGPDHLRVTLPPTGTAGIGFSSIIAAEDVAHNAVLTFTDAITLSTSNGGLITPQIVTPTAGVWTGAITLTTAGTGRAVRAQSGPITGTSTVDVSPGSVATVTIAPASATISAGVRITYTAVATDSFGNPIGDVTASTTFSITLDSGGTFAANVVTPTVAATWPVTGTHTNGVSNTAVLTVTPAAPATLGLAPATAVISAGARITYTAVATDTFGNFIGDVTTSTTFSIPIASGGTFVANVVTPTVASTWPVTGSNGLAVNTSTLTVTPAAFFRLSIEDAPAGLGAPIDAVTMTLYDTLTSYAVGYDVHNNPIGPRVATWAGSGIVSGTLSPIGGISTTLTPAPIVSGTGMITATSDNISDTTGLITILAPSMIITKLDNQDPVPAGSGLGYTIIYTNVGTAAAQGIVITETYDPDVSFVGAVPAEDAGSSGSRWSISGTLAAGQRGEIQVFVQVGDSLPISTVLTNTVRVSALKTTPSAYTETTEVTVTPTLVIAKVQVSPVGSSVRVSDTINYQLMFTNTGTAILHNVVVTETYDSAVEFVNAIPTPVPGSNNRQWNIGTLQAGQTGSIGLTVIVRAPQVDGAPLINIATIDSDETDPTSVQLPPIQIRAPMLSFSKHASSSTVAANSRLTYTLRYTNSGSTFASSVVVTDLLPSNVTLIDTEPPYSQQSGSLLTWNFPQVITNSAERISVTVLVNDNQDDGTVFTNTARIAAAENISAFARITNTVSSAPALSLSKSDGVPSAAAGDVLTYTLSYANTGNAPAYDVVITDGIPSNVAFQNCLALIICTPPSGGGDVVTFTLGSVDASTGGSVGVMVKVDSPLPAGLRAITNTARIQTPTAGDDPSDNFAQDVDTISTVPSLALGVVYSNTKPYPTKVVTYYLYYTNTSKMNTTGVVVSVTQSPYVTYIPVGSSSWTLTNGFHILPIGNLAAGASGTATFVVSLPVTFTPAMDAFVNTFLIHDDGPGGISVASAITTTVFGVPDLVIDRVIPSPVTIISGENMFTTTVTATVVIRNEGMGDACNAGFQFVAVCAAFNLNVFIDPPFEPPSFGFSDDPGSGLWYGYEPAERSLALGAGQVATVTTSVTVTNTQVSILYFKVDNWRCADIYEDGTRPCIPDDADHGLVPESDEYNNVFGPVFVTAHKIFMPVVLKNRS